MNADALNEQAVLAALKDFKDPETGRGVVEMEQIRDIKVAGDALELTLELTSHSAPLKETCQQQLTDRLKAKLPAAKQVTVNLAEHERPPQPLGEIGLKVKSVIAVGSGKGGVGKSTVAASIAYGLKRAGCKVGLMDADVYGPSIPHLTGVSGRPQATEDKKIPPIMSNGIPVMSMGFLVPPEQAVIWRGPMLHGAVTQFLRDTLWGELDYLIIDMPPGTGDIALTLSQLLPLTGSVVVCTPQEVALLDAVKAIAMFNTVKIPVLGMVENMSGFICPDNNKRYDIFGSGGARKKAEDMGVPFLGEVPITMSVRENGDAGTTDANFDDPQSATYFNAIVHQLVRVISDKAIAAPPQPSLPVLG